MQQHKPKMRKLGKTELELSALTMGTWGLFAESYGPVFPEQQVATLQRALDQGITTFDMAPTWDLDATSELSVAKAVGDRRAEVTYITRVGLVREEQGDQLLPAFSAEQLRAQCEGSLRRLGTDHIDVLLLQHPSTEALRDDSLRATMETLVSEGKVRAWGASVSHVDDARAALVTGAEVLCVPFNMLQPDIVWDIASECRERGVGLLARSVLLHGLLAGRWGEKKRFTPDDHRMHRWSHEALAARVRRANELKNRIAATAPTMLPLALQFVLAHDDVASAVFGPRTPAEVVSAVEALIHDLSLSVVDLQFIHNSVVD